MFVHPTNTTVILDLKRFLSIKNYFYQNQNITIIIKGESETCPISEIAIIILSLKFIGSFEAAAISFIGFFYNLAALVCFLAIPLFPLLSSPFCSNSFQIKNEQHQNSLRFERNAKHQGLLKITRINFTRRRTEVNFPSADWLSYLRTQLTVSVGGKVFQRFFLETIFSPEGDTKELQVKGNLFDGSQIYSSIFTPLNLNSVN